MARDSLRGFSKESLYVRTGPLLSAVPQKTKLPPPAAAHGGSAATESSPGRNRARERGKTSPCASLPRRRAPGGLEVDEDASERWRRGELRAPTMAATWKLWFCEAGGGGFGVGFKGGWGCGATYIGAGEPLACGPRRGRGGTGRSDSRVRLAHGVGEGPYRWGPPIGGRGEKERGGGLGWEGGAGPGERDKRADGGGVSAELIEKEKRGIGKELGLLG